jgi:hypothetical protein
LAEGSNQRKLLTHVVSIDTFIWNLYNGEVSYDRRANERPVVRDLDDKNPDDKAIKSRICCLCGIPRLVHITRTALDDIGLIPLTKEGVLQAVREHISGNRRVSTDRMDRGDTAYIIEECLVQGNVLYVKVSFFVRNNEERMLIISAHPPRKW